MGEKGEGGGQGCEGVYETAVRNIVIPNAAGI